MGNREAERISGQSNYRFINDKGKYVTEQAVMPGPDTFWECDTDKRGESNYIRAEVNDDCKCSRFDNGRLQEWDRLILLVKGKGLHSILFTVYNVDREDVWDKMGKIAGKVFESVVTKVGEKIAGVIPGNGSAYLPDSLGSADDDLRSFFLKEFAGNDDILFRRSCKFEVPKNRNCKNYDIEGCGEKGKYKISFSVKDPSKDCNE